MKKRLLLLTFALAVTSAMPVFAMPKLMADGTVFDAKYYRKNNPDVVAVLGSDENALFTHYTLFGKNEGRKPCEDGAVPVVPTYNFDFNDDCNGQWTEKKTWMASNGVVLRIKDEYSNWDFENNMAARAIYGASEVIIFDGQDLRPGSPFMDAVTEFQYGTGAHEGGAEKMKISPADLPLVATPATKQTSAPKTDSWNAYVEAFNPLWKLQATGNANAIGGNLSNYGTGIGLLGGNTSTYLWNLDWIGDCWKLTIRTNPTELQWNSIRNSLRNVSPDGDALYYAFYDEAYGSKAVFSSYDTWVNIGGSQAMSCVSDFQYYYFK